VLRQYIEYLSVALNGYFEAPTHAIYGNIQKTLRNQKMTTMSIATPVVDFTSFVFTQNDDIKTTSLIIAEKFSKSHAHVLRDIEKIMTQVSDIFNKTNFGLIEVDVKVGFGTRKDKGYELTKDGFIMVVMSYTGVKAFAIKEAYINAFNFMREKLTPKPYGLRDLPPATPIYLNPAMKKHINRRVDFLVRTQVGTVHGALGKSIQDKFNVNKRELIPIEKYAEVCAFLGCEPDEKALQGDLLEPAILPAPVVKQSFKREEILNHVEFNKIRINALEDLIGGMKRSNELFKGVLEA
jgi:Rha family phage regulatory protein